MILRIYQLLTANAERKFAILFMVALFLLLLMFSSNAQQTIGFTQFTWNQASLNPGYNGSHESVSARLFYRNQWAGFEGAPKTQSITVHSPISHGDFGVGLNVLRDQLGITDQTAVSGAFAYRMKMPVGRLALGLSGEYRNISMQWSSLNPEDEVDDYLPTGDASSSVVNFGFGAYYESNRFFAGVSVPGLLEPTVNVGMSSSMGLEIQRHVYAMTGVVFDLSKNVQMKPSMMVRYTQAAPLQVDANVSVLLNETFWVGASYRLGDSGDLMIQYLINSQFSVGYSYDFTFSKIQNHGGSHEFFLGFDLQRKSDGYDHPRYF
jgi:type IX secretion system PorP/SprF family membrane protein